jgi:hypothetical protein
MVRRGSVWFLASVRRMLQMRQRLQRVGAFGSPRRRRTSLLLGNVFPLHDHEVILPEFALSERKQDLDE